MPRIRGTSLAEHRAATRQQVFAALARLVAERGFAVLTMADLAEAAEVGRSSLYNHFRDLEAVVDANAILASNTSSLSITALAAGCAHPGRVAGLHEALSSERTRRGRMVQDMPHPVVGTTPVFASPYRLDGERLPIRMAPPTLGEGTRAVLQQLLALSDDELQALQAQGVLTLPQQ